MNRDLKEGRLLKSARQRNSISVLRLVILENKTWGLISPLTPEHQTIKDYQIFRPFSVRVIESSSRKTGPGRDQGLMSDGGRAREPKACRTCANAKVRCEQESSQNNALKKTLARKLLFWSIETNSSQFEKYISTASNCSTKSSWV